MNKQTVYEAFKTQVETKIRLAQRALDETAESVHAETKGSAGDKHETGRAMAQIEMENTGKVLFEAQQLASVLHLLEPGKSKTACALGALVETTQGIFYLSGGIGKLNVDGKAIYCIGMSAPLGQALLGKGVGDEYVVGGRTFEILRVG